MAIIGKNAWKAFQKLTHAHDFHVLMVLLARMTEQNRFLHSQDDVARDLCLPLESVSLAYERLLASEIILKSNREKDVYYFHPELGWWGTQGARLPAYEALWHRQEQTRAANSPTKVRKQRRTPSKKSE
jgi:hypothetical protein